MESIPVVALAFILCCLLCFINGGTSSSQCLDNVPQYGSRGMGSGVSRLVRDNIYIIPDYTFSCYGKVTQWGACVEQDGGDHEIVFSVYRPSDDPNCYSLVGTNIILDGTAIDGCVTLNVPESDQISVEPGDVVGLFYTLDDPGDVGIETDITVTNITAWYTETLQPASTGCPYKTGPDGNFPTPMLAAPVITAVVEPFNSLELTPTITTPLLPTPPHPPTTPDTGLRPSSGPPTIGIAVGATVAAVVLVTLTLLLLVVIWVKCRSRRKTRARTLTTKNEETEMISTETYATPANVNPYKEMSHDTTQNSMVLRNQAYRTAVPSVVSADQSSGYSDTLREIDAYAALYEEVDLEDIEYT